MNAQALKRWHGEAVQMMEGHPALISSCEEHTALSWLVFVPGCCGITIWHRMQYRKPF